MSYILDALKKADAERERRGVPSLSAQSATHADDERRSGRGAGMAIIGVLVALALGAWWWISGRDNTGAPAPVVVAAPAPAPLPSVATITPPAPAKPIAVPPPIIVPPAPVVTAPPPTVTTAPTAPTVAAVTPSVPADGRTPALNELSTDQRRQLPPLNVSGAVYSAQASGRMVFINGQVLREGDAVAEGLVVERIGAKSSVLSLRGMRFELKH